MIFITTYNRQEMLKELVQDLQSKTDEQIIIMDDCTPDFDFQFFKKRNIKVIQSEVNGGKKLFFQQWQKMLDLAKQSSDQFFLFLADDFQNVNIEQIRKVKTAFSESDPFALNIINDGRLICFRHKTPVQTKIQEMDVWNVGFVDCGFLCNRIVLELLQFTIKPIDQNRWNHNPLLSSGVGDQLTQRFAKAGVQCFIPFFSLAEHGDHESVMHKEERKRNPLISK